MCVCVCVVCMCVCTVCVCSVCQCVCVCVRVVCVCARGVCVVCVCVVCVACVCVLKNTPDRYPDISLSRLLNCWRYLRRAAWETAQSDKPFLGEMLARDVVEEELELGRGTEVRVEQGRLSVT